MNPEDALNEIRQQQDEMMRAAQLMEERVNILKKLNRCFSEGYQWRFAYSIDQSSLLVGGVRIVCAHSGAWTELHPTNLDSRGLVEAGVIHITFNGVDYTLVDFLNNKKGEEE